MATTKRAYKLQEFVAHSSNVNCLKIGRKSSRVLVTGGEDHKVNLWTIGKPDAILSLSGHTSAIESVNFDSSERLVAAGAASGTIKLWDLEEAKIVRTLTGHRSNCVSVDFHPFGEFFASGSLDTNLKIWDIRRKGCIHTYKGHTRGVNAIRFTPDGRWVVSGGEDNTVKLWDLTAGKLLHDFKCHDGQIQCIDFHPHEFLLATGSADKTVKFWDLETFELIGSAGPETAGVRSMTFNSDGRTLLCGLHESLKVFSWEPVRCHDTLDVGWSKLSDMNIHEGKLLGCSYNQSCVGVWVVDISRIEPYTVASNGRPSSCSESKLTSANLPNGIGRLSVSQDAIKETKSRQSSGSAPSTPQRTSLNTGSKMNVAAAPPPGNATLKRTSSKTHGNLTNAVNTLTINKSDVGSVTVPRNNLKVEQSSEYRKEIDNGKPVPYNMQLKLTDCQEMSKTSDLDRRMNITAQSGFTGGRKKEANSAANQDVMSQPIMIEEKKFDGVRCIVPPRMGVGPLAEPSTSYHQENYDNRTRKSRPTTEAQGGGRMRSLVANWERREVPSSENTTSNNTIDVMPSAKAAFMRRHVTSTEKETVSASDEDAIADLMEHHKQFMNSAQSRLTKLQVVHRLWDRKDFRGVISAMEKMSDYAVSADVISVISEKSNIITLDLCTIFLPLLTSLLESNMDRHLTVSIEMMLKLVKVFGNVIHSTISGPPLVGVDLQAEQRLERCNICYIELEKIKQRIPSLIRRGGSIAKLTQELKLALQEIV